MMRVRSATAADTDFLWEMLLLAAHEGRPLAEARADPDFRRYVEGYGRDGDLGVIAEDDDGRLVGAAWLRRWEPDDRGYGYVDAETPEIAVAVAEGHRGRGVGEAMLRALLERAAAEGYATVSLSVRLDNPARRLYERLGFEDIPGSDAANRAGTESATMVWRAASG